VGVIYWAIFGVANKLLDPIIESQNQGTGEYGAFGAVLIIVLVCMGFLGVHFAGRGCNLGGQYRFGSVGYILKMFVLIIFVLLFGLLPGFSLFDPTGQIVCRSVTGLIFVIALVPIVFWTGRGLLRRFYGV